MGTPYLRRPLRSKAEVVAEIDRELADLDAGRIPEGVNRDERIALLRRRRDALTEKGGTDA